MKNSESGHAHAGGLFFILTSLFSIHLLPAHALAIEVVGGVHVLTPERDAARLAALRDQDLTVITLLAISNVPFGDLAVHDPTVPAALRSTIHDYFFAKALRLVRPGGLVVFLTSWGTLDKQAKAVRTFLNDRACVLSLKEAHALLLAADGQLDHRKPYTTKDGRTKSLPKTNPRYALIYHLLLALGLRRGEALGLSWADLDWEAGTLQVRRQVQPINGKVVISEYTKQMPGSGCCR
ncbi:MAG: hypothetical protein WCI67_11685 [Chloroflexales bacterium]